MGKNSCSIMVIYGSKGAEILLYVSAPFFVRQQDYCPGIAVSFYEKVTK
jgi:hypothetical protein